MAFIEGLGILTDDIFSNRINLTGLLLCTGISLAFLLVYGLLAQKRRKSIWYGLLLEYVWLIFSFTVICRRKGELEQFYPIPFYDGGLHQFGVQWPEMLLNVIMFVPIGILLKLAFARLKWYHVMVIGLLLSASIEALQWIFRCGACETNDLINNTIGTLIGYWSIKKKVTDETK